VGREYDVRHPGVARFSNTGNALYYSFNYGMAHVVTFNSETYIAGGIDAMLAWLAADIAAIDRNVTPWVVCQAHKLYYMDGDIDFSRISPLVQQGCDLLFAGHDHVYTRYVPLLPTPQNGHANQTLGVLTDFASVLDANTTYRDPLYTTMILSGAPGDHERNDACPVYPELAALQLACSMSYGYGILSIDSPTRLSWAYTGRMTDIGESPRNLGPIDYFDQFEIVRSAPPSS